jgi:hypothetical protein
MTQTLKTLTLSVTLAAMFLSAGAFADLSPKSDMISKPNVTVIHKTSAWPPKGQITVDACTVRKCIAV